MPTTDRKHQILEAARELFQTQGFEGFSYRDLSDRLGIAKPSIHHHFATKEELGLALIDSYTELLARFREEIARGAATPAAELEAFLRFSETECVESGHAMCPGGALHAGFETFPSSMQAATRRLSEQMHAWMTDLLRRGSEAGQMRFPGTPEDQAWLLMATLQGARQQARTHGIEVWRAVSRQIASSILGSA